MDNWICLQSWGLYVFSIAFFFAVFVISVLLIKAMLIPSLQLFSLPGHINSSRLKTDLTGSNYHNTTNKDKQNKPKEGGLSNQAAMLISADWTVTIKGPRCCQRLFNKAAAGARQQQQKGVIPGRCKVHYAAMTYCFKSEMEPYLASFFPTWLIWWNVMVITSRELIEKKMTKG